MSLIIKDHLGNTRVSFKANGNNLEKNSETAFDPYGVRLPIGVNNAFQNRFEFLNREKESTFGLNRINLLARTYNPTTGRFDRTDPIIEGQENYSLYQYGYNNPVLNSDPNGDCPKCLKALAKTAIKSVIKGKVDLGEVYDVIDAGRTLLDPNASLLDKGLAVFDVVSPISTKEAKAVGKFIGVVDDANDAVKTTNKVDNAKDIVTVSRKSALNDAKRDLGIPKSQHPNVDATTGKQYNKVPMTDKNGKAILDKNGKPITTREYTYTTPDGKKVIIQDHSAGHQYPNGTGNQGAHFNVRPPENTRTGKVSGTQEHYPFNN